MIESCMHKCVPAMQPQFTAIQQLVGRRA